MSSYFDFTLLGCTRRFITWHPSYQSKTRYHNREFTLAELCYWEFCALTPCWI